MAFQNHRSGPEFLMRPRNIESNAVGAHSSSYIVSQMIPAYKACNRECGKLRLSNSKLVFSTNTARDWEP